LTGEDRPEGNDRVISKSECPKCHRSKAFVTYADGHSHCYGAGCDYFEAAPTGSDPKPTSSSPTSRPSSVNTLEPDSGSWPRDGLPKRRIKLDTMRKFGVFTPGWNGERVQVYPYFNAQGEPAGQKLRTSDKSSFPFLKAEGYQPLAECQLFGRHVFGDRFDRQVIICEGELDAMSVAQETDFKTAVVSVNSGAQSAAKVLKANYLWLDRFEEIILWLDDDEPGQLATEECAKLFKVGKVRIAKAGNGFKDASDLLQADRPGDIKAAIYSAVKWRPKGIVNAADNEDDVTTPKEESHAFSIDWPWVELGAMFGPMLPGQVVYHVAGTGVGKTTAQIHIILSAIQQGAKVALLSFEGTRREIKLAIMTVGHGERVDIEPLPDDKMRELHRLYFGHRKLELFDPETAEWSQAAIEGYVRYCAKALDCQIVVIDPLSYVVAGMDQNADERRGLDMASRNLAGMAKELGVHLQISHHLSRPDTGPGHEEGAPTSLKQIRGSGGIAMFATIVIGHERNQQAEGEDALLTQLRSLKNRPRSKTGPIMVVKYDVETGQLSPTNKQFPRAGSGRVPQAGSRDTPFAPADGQDY